MPSLFRRAEKSLDYKAAIYTPHATIHSFTTYYELRTTNYVLRTAFQRAALFHSPLIDAAHVTAVA